MYAVLLYLKQKIRHPKVKKEKKEDTNNSDSDEKETVLLSCQNGQSAVTILSQNGEDETRKRHSSSYYQYARLDRYFLFFFPFLFLIFHTLYWGYFSVWDLWQAQE